MFHRLLGLSIPFKWPGRQAEVTWLRVTTLHPFGTGSRGRHLGALMQQWKPRSRHLWVTSRTELAGDASRGDISPRQAVMVQGTTLPLQSWYSTWCKVKNALWPCASLVIDWLDCCNAQVDQRVVMSHQDQYEMFEGRMGYPQHWLGGVFWPHTGPPHARVIIHCATVVRQLFIVSVSL